ncbi:MAG: hypothetical protein U0U66_08550 [Cytophagaceae bacterium]
MIKSEEEKGLTLDIIVRLPMFYTTLLIIFISILVSIYFFSSLFNGQDILKSLAAITIVICILYYFAFDFYKNIILYKKLYLQGIPIKMHIISIEEIASSVDTPNKLIFNCISILRNNTELRLTITKTFYPNPYEEGEIVDVIYLPENNTVGYFIDYCPYSDENRKTLKRMAKR